MIATEVLIFQSGQGEKRIQRRRFLIGCIFVALLTAVLLSRMVYLQLLRFDHYQLLSEDNRIRIEPIVPVRGRIFDRNGVILADGRSVYSLEIVPEVVPDMDALLRRLADIISITPEDRQRFHSMRRRKSGFEAIPIRIRLSEQEVAQFMVNRPFFDGVEVVTRWSRHYPLEKVAAHLIGYVGRINEQELKTIDSKNYQITSYIGKTGVEKIEEDILHGTVGYQHVEINAEGRTIRILEKNPPVPGIDLYLTIDAKVQRVAEQAFTNERGAVVAIEPKTGAVLAFASMPTYNLNLFTDRIHLLNAYAALRDSEDRPLFNRVLQGQYPPGSTIKPFVGLAGLETAAITADKKRYCRGWYRLPNHKRRYRDWKESGHGQVNINAAIAQSCDVYFYQLALMLGIDRLHDYLEGFGFGRRSTINLFGEARGLLPSAAWKQRVYHQPWYPGETLITGIGQGFMLVTPLQLALATATLAMRGHRIKPQIVLRRHDAVADTVKSMQPIVLPKVRVNDALNWRTIIAAMVEVVHGAKGTARRIAAGATYRIAGKTGTSQVFSLDQDQTYDPTLIPKRLHDHALFIAFAPVAKPLIAVAVIVENGGSGSKTAAPIARRVMDAWLNRAADRGDEEGHLEKTQRDGVSGEGL